MTEYLGFLGCRSDKTRDVRALEALGYCDRTFVSYLSNNQENSCSSVDVHVGFFVTNKPVLCKNESSPCHRMLIASSSLSVVISELVACPFSRFRGGNPSVLASSQQ